MGKVTTLNEFIHNKQADFPFATGELSQLLSDISVASKVINKEINKAGLVDILGAVGNTNIQGEE
ncbi:MAG: fructose-bisphosphatase class I, partial [Vicingaceae bacterium]